jgi:hypothetical protein
MPLANANNSDDDDTDCITEYLNGTTTKLLYEIDFRYDSTIMKILKAFDAANPFSENFINKKALSPILYLEI